MEDLLPPADARTRRPCVICGRVFAIARGKDPPYPAFCVGCSFRDGVNRECFGDLAWYREERRVLLDQVATVNGVLEPLIGHLDDLLEPFMVVRRLG